MPSQVRLVAMLGASTRVHTSVRSLSRFGSPRSIGTSRRKSAQHLEDRLLEYAVEMARTEQRHDVDLFSWRGRVAAGTDSQAVAPNDVGSARILHMHCRGMGSAHKGHVPCQLYTVNEGDSEVMCAM